MNPALEAYFGNPEGLLRLASALEPTSDRPWTLRKTRVAQGKVTGAWAAANAAWVEARAELAIDTVSMLGPLKDISLGLVRAVDDIARFGLAAADFANRFSPERWWSDPGGAVDDAKSTA